ncbi:uncharacterized protein LOC115480074 [Microcaecilia unicolor]|uniref:Uncharacterized protein LOC115480074 n=1 Tax=Microcaecilia unicolor TaxID=1415580 RepID=A0A6P7ZG43_9AMPH|nr:uncharacterized protein LOC115480074 [Microcaecilia unicolor]
METMGEFDKEYPLSMTFCKLMTEEEFEEQSISYTEQSLGDLYKSMDQNPALFERVIRKKKQKEQEKAGIASFLKAKFFSAVEGDLNCCNAVDKVELKQRLKRMKQEMEKVNSYAQEAKSAKLRTSKRLAEKRNVADRQSSCCPLPLQQSKVVSSVVPLPTPPPAPPIFMPLGDQTRLQQVENSVMATPESLSRHGLQQLNHKSLPDVPSGISYTSDLPDGLSFQSELLASNHMKRLRYTSIERSPGGTPLKSQTRKILDPSLGRSPISAFNTALLTKFHSVASSDGEESESENSGFKTPAATP